MFNYFKPRLVQFIDGKYGIVKRNFLKSNTYLGRDLYWWYADVDINMYCKFNTGEGAVDAFNEYNKKQYIKKNIVNYKVISILDDEWDIV